MDDAALRLWFSAFTLAAMLRLAWWVADRGS
jgi:hypothetical protein